MKILIDTREQKPLEWSAVETQRATLHTGDYSIEGYEESFTVERKSLEDLVGSLTAGRERFLRECERLQGFYFRRILVVGSYLDMVKGRYRSKAHPNSIVGSLYSIEARHNIPVVWAANPNIAAHIVMNWGKWFIKDHEENCPF